uniref:Cytochrome b-c1 complex subunit 7 n=1 Tax=Eptatretus burgeri TaxID=7764 RepID=A0A8C4Q970_EPTBU
MILRHFAGLMHDDMLYETPVVQEAIRRLPETMYDERAFRIKMALDLSMKHRILPESQWTKYEEDVGYLQPYIHEVERELKEKAEWEKNL